MERRERVSKTIAIVFFIMAFFNIFQIAAPLSLPSESYVELEGTVGIIDNKQAYETMGFPWDIIYLSGDLLCHQKPDRSFFLNGNQMPFCSRCTAIWFGFFIGLAIILFYQIELNERYMLLIILSLIPIGIDGTGQLFGFWESSNLSRVITGSIIGVPVGTAIGIIIYELKSLLKTKNS